MGKISRLPNEIREQLNHRLLDGELSDTLLPWLNSLPEAQTVLAAHFNGEPISEQNLSQYRKHNFRRWQIRQDALEFAAEEAADLSPSRETPNASPLVDHLAHWIATRFAAAAQNAPISEDQQTDLREIRTLLGDIVTLRRGDLVARRLGLEQQRLALLQSKNQAELEKLFWEWTKRPDIQAKLYPNRDPDQIRLDAVRVLDQHLGVTSTAPQTTPPQTGSSAPPQANPSAPPQANPSAPPQTGSSAPPQTGSSAPPQKDSPAPPQKDSPAPPTGPAPAG